MDPITRKLVETVKHITNTPTQINELREPFSGMRGRPGEDPLWPLGTIITKMSTRAREQKYQQNADQSGTDRLQRHHPVIQAAVGHLAQSLNLEDPNDLANTADFLSKAVKDPTNPDQLHAGLKSVLQDPDTNPDVVPKNIDAVIDSVKRKTYTPASSTPAATMKISSELSQ